MSQKSPSRPAEGNEPAEEETDLAGLKRKSVRGGVVTMVSQAITIGIQLTSTVVLARLLSPEDYGILAMVMAVTAFAGIFREMGLSSAAIQKKGLTRAQQSNLFWINAAMGLVLTLMVAAASPLVAWFYKKPELLYVTIALSFNFIISSLATQHGAMLIRNMQFGRKAIATISGSLVTLAVAVILALQQYSYWALVWGMLAGALTTSALTLWLSPFRPSFPSKGSGIRDMLGFGANVTGFDLVNYFARNLDNLLIGRYWGAIDLGIYSRAYQILMFPVNAVRGPVTSVAFPALSKLDSSSPEYRVYYVSVLKVMASVTVPMTVLIFLLADDIVPMMLGAQWVAVVPVFKALCLAALVQPTSSLRGLILLSSGYGAKYLKSGIISSIAVTCSFGIGMMWGVLGVAWAYSMAVVLLAQPMHMYCSQNTSVKSTDLFMIITKPLILSLLMGGALFFLTYLKISFLVECSISIFLMIALIGFLLKNELMVSLKRYHQN